MSLRELIRWISPHGLIHAHRRRFQMQRLGLPPTPAYQEAVEQCRYDLWPAWLRTSTDRWTLVDVGANQGDFTRAVTTLAKPHRVYAFEPQAGCLDALREILSRVPEGVLIEKAVGDREGSIEINVTRNDKLASVLVPDQRAASGYPAGDFEVANTVEVGVTTLDQALAEVEIIELLKIDVQGFERQVLQGAQSVLSRSRAVLMEVNYVPHYEGGAVFDDVYRLLCDSGFRLSGVSAPYSSGQEGPLWADALFERPPTSN